jgi:hypothetical protein
MSVWTQSDRERAYTSLCEAVTAAGQSAETLFLARLALLLMEELKDAHAFSRCLTEASAPSGGTKPIAPAIAATASQAGRAT